MFLIHSSFIVFSFVFDAFCTPSAKRRRRAVTQKRRSCPYITITVRFYHRLTKSNRFFRPSVHFLRLVKKAADSVRGLRAFYTKPFYSLRFPAARQKNKAGALHGRRSQKHTAPRLPWLCVGLYLRCAGAFQPRFRLQSTQKRTGIQAFLSVLGCIISLSCRSRLSVTRSKRRLRS